MTWGFHRASWRGAVRLWRAVHLRLLTLAAFWIGALAASSSQGQPIRVMPLGDSITAGSNAGGYRAPLLSALTTASLDVDFVGGESRGAGFDADHEGHSGWTDDQIAAQTAWFLNRTPADIVLLHIGTNGLNPDPSGVEQILDAVDSVDEDIVVVLALIIDRAVHEPMVTQFNDNIAAMAISRMAAGDRILLVDMEDALTYPDDLADNVHPNEVGYAKMAGVWLPAVVQAASLVTQREVIGIDCTGSLSTGNHISPLVDTDVLGVAPQVFWNTTGENAASGLLLGLRGASGAFHALAAASWGFEGSGWSQNQVDNEPIPPASIYQPSDRNHKLMGGLLWDSQGASLTVFNLDTVFGAGAGYSVIVYVDAWDNGHEGQWTSNIDVGGTTRVVHSVSYSDPTAGFDDATEDQIGNFVSFTGVVGDTVTVRATPFGGGTAEDVAFLNGVQIVGCLQGGGHPSILGSPVATAVCEGEDATFQIDAAGSGVLSYQWFRDGNPVGPDAPVLVLEGALLSDRGSLISCRVTDACGAILSESAALDVWPSLPTLVQDLQDVSLCSGETAVFQVVPADGEGQIHFRWRRNGLPVGDNGDTFSVPCIGPWYDQNVITCDVSSPCGTRSSAEAVVTVRTRGTGDLDDDGVTDGRDIAPFVDALLGNPTEPSPEKVCAADFDGDGQLDPLDVERFVHLLLSHPTIVEQPAVADICEGMDASFSVVAVGAGVLHYQWRHGCSPVGGDSPDLVLSNGTVAEHDTLVTCDVFDDIGQVGSLPAALRVWPAATGDGDRNGTVDGLDIAPFVEILLGGGPDTPAATQCAYDFDASGLVDPDDIPPFIVILVGH